MTCNSCIIDANILMEEREGINYVNTF